MSQTPSTIPFSISITNFPQVILLGKYQYDFLFNANNYLPTLENYTIKFTSDSLQLFGLEQFTTHINFIGGETKQFNIKAQPTKDGIASLNIEVIHQKMTQFTEMVWKVRDKVEQSLIQKIMTDQLVSVGDLKNYKSKLQQTIDTTGLTIMSLDQAKVEVERINTPPPLPPLREVSHIIEKELIKEVPKEIEKKIPQPPLIDPITGEETPQPPKIEKIIIMEKVPEKISETVSEMIQDPAPPELSSEEKDPLLLSVARSVFMQNPAYGFEVLNMITNLEMKNSWMLHFIPTGILLDYKSALTQIMDLADNAYKNQYFEMIAYSIGPENPQDAAMIALNISDESKRDDILKDIIFAISESNPEIASNLVYQITNEAFQRKILFEVIKRWASINRDQAVIALQSLIQNVLSEINTEFIKMCMIFLAYLTSPQSVYDVIEKFDHAEKITLYEQLQDYLKVQVEEIRTRVDPIPLGTLSYRFPTAVHQITPSIEFLAGLAGNISGSLLERNVTSNISIICPYKFQFSVNTNFQQAYFDELAELKKSINYIIFPSKNGFDEDEKHHFLNILNQFFIVDSKNSPNPHLIFNFDLIPYLSKPSIFLSGESEIINSIYQKLIDTFGNEVNIGVNDTFFSNGEMNFLLQTSLPEPKFKIINIVLTYNFLNQYNLLKSFFNALLS